MTTSWHQSIFLGNLVLLVSVPVGCDRKDPNDVPSHAAAALSAREPTGRPAVDLRPAGSASVTPPEQERAQERPQCPAGMLPIPGGDFWVGGDFNDDERPNFLAKVFDFCLDETEVTLQSYDECVDSGACTRAKTDRLTCNQSRASTHRDHPVNCVDHRQATAYCTWKHARLPSEVEWEYAARGGDKYYRYSWGNEPPDGHTCWKHGGGSCKVKSFPAGAFGLYDMTGNVWEWTSDWFGPYPWERMDGHARVYRGGSWSRRFVKWMRPQLRNRYPEWQSGSHLGFRCAATPDEVECRRQPDDPKRCTRVVKDVKCSARKSFNGVRCARPDEPRCREGFKEVPGHGCVREEPLPEPENQKNAVDTRGVSRTRSPEFDEDCLTNYPGRPNAFRYTGGNHAGRNAVSRKVGCKNRDVGAGWNSCCCP